MKSARHTLFATLLGFLVVACTRGGDEASPEAADLILTGGKVYTSNEGQPWADSIAIRDGRFAFVGDAAGATAFQSDNTRVVDLDGRLVTPGLIDAHAHPAGLGQTMAQLDLVGTDSLAEVLKHCRFTQS